MTKFRHKVFADAHVRRMDEIMQSVCTDFECDLVESWPGRSRPCR
ncbi:hypothetical protein [Streptomyces acidicola]